MILLKDNISLAVHWWRVDNDFLSGSIATTISWVFKNGEALYQSIGNRCKNESLGMMMG